jgi:hypothetical protein
MKVSLLVLLTVVVAGLSEPSAGLAQPWTATSDRCSSAATAAAADALATKFDDHQFIFIGSTHGDLKIEEFLMCLVSRPAFKQRVTDIVVEWASSGHQRLLDRYLLTLDEIPVDALTPVWFDTDAPTLWTTLPQVRQFVQTLREVNKTLPAAKRIRLVGGNDGTDWAKVRVVEDLAPYPFKTNFMPHLIIEHLAKTPGNRTLVVYGDGHIRYKGNNFMGDLEEALGRTKLFVVGRIGELRPEERRYLAAVGDPDKSFFVESGRFPTTIPWPGSLRVTYEERSENLADYIDAFVYLGPEPDKNLIGSIPLSAEQRRELDRRNSIMSDPQRTMRVRYEGRDQWFRAHPNDVPPRP